MIPKAAAPDAKMCPREPALETDRQQQRLKWHAERHERAEQRMKARAVEEAALRICTMQTILPEGGYFVMQWPESIAPESLNMVEGLFKLQWDSVREWVAEREKELDRVIAKEPHNER